MFNTPLARVFIDGRADQLYNTQHFERYWALMDGRTSSQQMLRILNETHTDAALLRRAGAAALLNTLQFSPDWTLALINSHYVLFLRRGSQALTRLTDLIRKGKVWRQADGDTLTPYSEVSRAMVLLTTSPPQIAKALALFEEAINRQPPLGRMFYPNVTRLLKETAGTAAATEYLQLQAKRITSDETLDPKLRAILLAALEQSRSQILAVSGGSALPSALPSRTTRTR
jgi:hypothetical protein